MNMSHSNRLNYQSEYRYVYQYHHVKVCTVSYKTALKYDGNVHTIFSFILIRSESPYSIFCQSALTSLASGQHLEYGRLFRCGSKLGSSAVIKVRLIRSNSSATN